MNKSESRICSLYKLIEPGSVALITKQINRYYYSNFQSSDGILIIYNNKADLILDFRYYEDALINKEKGLIPSECNVILSEKPLFEYVNDICEKYHFDKIYFEDTEMTVAKYEKLKSAVKRICEYKSLSNIILSMRASKDDVEISNIAEAQKITDKAFSHILKIINDKMTENEVVCELEYFCKKSGADEMSFDTIFISGNKTSIPHGVPSNSKITKGFITLDFGVKFNGYCSDMTRTFCLGKPDDDMKLIYSKVLEAQNAAFSKIAAGVQGSIVDKAAREIIYSAGYEKCFGHSTGHSLGLEIHESPNFSSYETQLIPENAVLSVEPGIYLQGKFGVRIEDIVVVKQNGYENLTKSVKDLIIL